MNKWMIAGVALSFLLASCSKDDDNTPQSGNNTNVNGGAVVSFSSNIFASVVVEVTGPGTRAPITAFEPNAQLGVFGIPAIQGNHNSDCDLFNKKNESDFQANLFNACYTYVPGYETLQTEKLATFPNTSNAGLMMYGYYPYTEEAEWREVNRVAQWAIPWKLTPSNMSETKDYMFTGQTPTWYSEVGTNPIMLNFQHAFGRLDFSFYSTSKQVCDAGYRIQSVTVYCNTGESGWMALTDGTLSFSPKDLICLHSTNNAGITYNTPGESVAKFMFPPEQTLIQKITCQVKDGGNNLREYTIYDYKYYGYDISIKKGKTTLMRINFLPKDATLSGPANVDSWTGGNTVDENVKLQ